jgi:hypothetical protein
MKGFWRGAWVGLLLVGCESAKPSSVPRLWPTADLRELARANGRIAGLSVSDWVTLRGNPIPLLSPPYATPARLQTSDRDGLNVLPAFAEGKSAAYAVAEAWQNIPQVWIQPWYVLVTSYNPASPGSTRLPGSLALVDIDTTSWFYSPFWQFVYAVVPANTAPDKYVSAAQLFQDNLEMHVGGGILAPLAPDDILPSVAQSAPSPLRPFSNDVVGTATSIPIALKGTIRPSTFFRASFTWNSTGVVDETPLFVFSRIDNSGQTVPFGLPNVIGTGPIGSGRPARVTPAGIPQFGALSRVYLTLLPPTAGIFIPSSQTALRDYFRSLGGLRVGVDPISPAVEACADAKDYVLRVALNSAQCFTAATCSAGHIVSTCQWLDSQNAIETGLAPSSLLRQDLLLTSPILYFNGVKVGP